MSIPPQYKKVAIMIDPLQLIYDLYSTNEKALSFLIPHSRAVAEFALRCKISRSCDRELIYRGAMLHDIGILFTDAPSIGCYGEAPYIQHGILGAEYLRKIKLFDEADICQNHIGVGLTAEQIAESNLPLPQKDYIPKTEEERVIAYADLFFSKRPEYLTTAKPFNMVLESVCSYGSLSEKIFLEWHEKFNPDLSRG